MKEAIFKYNLGAHTEDVITGFKGVVVGRTQYLTGCVQYGLQKKGLTKDGKVAGWQWFDESRLKLSSSETLKIDQETEPGGPAPMPPQC